MSMRSLAIPGALSTLLLLGLAGGTSAVRAGGPDWAANVTVIEACSCPMFCQCYFATKPAAHAGHHGGSAEHFCRANMAHRVNRGHYGATKLDGVKYWVANDLGPDFSQLKMDWAVLYFDKAATPPQREAIQAIMKHVFPVQWASFTTAEGSIDKWEFTNDVAHATLDGGKTAEVKLHRVQGNTNAPVVISNLKYWGVPRHDGFVLMPNEVEAYRVGPKAFEFKGTNGFMITWDMTSKDVPAAAGSN